MSGHFTRLLAERLERSPRPMIRSAEGDLTGPEVLDLASGYARWLATLPGVEGGVVPALVDASPHSLALAIAGACSGRPLAPLGPKLGDPELVGALRNVRAEVVVAEARYAEVAERIGSAAGAAPFVLPERVTPGRLVVRPMLDDTPVAVIHTSGTTGIPKPVAIGQAQMAARVGTYSQVIELGEGDSFMTASPLYHIAGLGMYLVCLGAGAAVVTLPGFSVDGWKEEVRRTRPTHALLVPTMIDMLLEAGDLDVEGLRVIQYGAAPIHLETLQQAMKSLPDVRLVQVFGQTEASPMTSLSHDDHQLALDGRPELLGSVGRAVEGIRLRIEEPDAEGIGEVVVSGSHVFQADATGWRHTGDLGRLDDDGYLFLHGRKGDRIIRGGENIYPQEVEAVLRSHPEVADAAVVGVSDRRWGQTVRAVLVFRDDTQPPSIDDVRTFARERLAGFKVPTEWLVRTELPRNVNGKLLRRELQH